ncbi:alpha/beta hydrolase [Pendulispora albinea]|uniref:Lysophospholipase n=1 Tax=Pendulispora albinea TaxID=2741071 RepID=A0ABZ2M5U7_9BACT
MTIARDEGPITHRRPAGPDLYFVSAMPKKARAVVGILPGYADHAARYTHVMDAWAERGIGSVALDMRGHGRAHGTRGHCVRFDEFLDDAGEVARLLGERAKGVPAFLMGHSFGGLVATHSVLESARSWRGLLLTGPYFGLALQVPRAKLALGRIASRIVPKLGLPTGIAGKDLTHDPVRARGYEEDPLVFPLARARWFRETVKAQERLFQRTSEIALPLYIAFGGADPVAKLEAGKQWFDAVRSPDKTWDPREGLLHEVLNELSWRDIADTMATWMLDRAK